MPWGRVGSNLTMGVLQGTRQVRVWNEPLTGIETRVLAAGGTQDDVWQAQADWLDRHIVQCTDRTPVVLNLAAISIARADLFAAQMAPARPRYILLDRRDDGAVALSTLRTAAWVAEGAALGLARSWAIPAGGQPAQAPEASAVTGSGSGDAAGRAQDASADFRPELDPDQLRKALGIIRQGRDLAHWLAADKAPLTYYYEDLVLDMQGVLNDLLATLHLDWYPYRIHSRRFGHTDLAQMVSNPGPLWSVLQDLRIPTRLRPGLQGEPASP